MRSPQNHSMLITALQPITTVNINRKHQHSRRIPNLQRSQTLLIRRINLTTTRAIIRMSHMRRRPIRHIIITTLKMILTVPMQMATLINSMTLRISHTKPRSRLRRTIRINQNRQTRIIQVSHTRHTIKTTRLSPRQHNRRIPMARRMLTRTNRNHTLSHVIRQLPIKPTNSRRIPQILRLRVSTKTNLTTHHLPTNVRMARSPNTNLKIRHTKMSLSRIKNKRTRPSGQVQLPGKSVAYAIHRS